MGITASQKHLNIHDATIIARQHKSSCCSKSIWPSHLTQLRVASQTMTSVAA